MKLALIAFTKGGGALASRLQAGLTAQGDVCTLSLPPRMAAEFSARGYESLQAWTREAFQAADGLVFVGACGIAVRAVAPCIRDKFTDPAVVAADEGGSWAVPLLSGHVGGANALARRVAAIMGGRAAISTATDVNGCFAVDEWAKKSGLYLADRAAAKQLSAALLAGETVGFASDFPVSGPLPRGVCPEGEGCGFYVTTDEVRAPFAQTLRLVPPVLHVGIGCRRGTSAQAIAEAVDGVLRRFHLCAHALKEVDTITLKQDEPGLLEFCAARKLPLFCHSPQALLAVPGSFTPSAFVAQITGVDNVCERAACLGGPRLLIEKQAANGVTVAIAAEDFIVRFEEEPR